MTDRQTDRRTGKNNMSPDPVGGRHNCIVYIAGHQTLKIILQSRFIFNFQVYGLPPLYMQKAYSKTFLGIIVLLVYRFSKFLQHFLGLLGCKKMT